MISQALESSHYWAQFHSFLIIKKETLVYLRAEIEIQFDEIL